MEEGLRKAASVIVARDGADGFEVVVLERGGATRFLPGYVAFPGGSVDEEDARLAERWFGTREESARACAVRELLEEVGLALTAGGLDESADRALEEALSASPPTPDQLPEVAHWVAPVQVPVRFDARYFALEAPAGLRLVPDGDETAAAWWASPRELLEAWRTGRRKLYWPTYFTLQAIAPCERVADLLALRIDTREPELDEVERLPRSTFWQD
ncbi:MAG: NUDIX hydrolase [Actinomycetota bacterium]